MIWCLPGNHDNPRPPEAENKTLDTSTFDTDLDTAHLLEMLVSEFQEYNNFSEESDVGEASSLDGNLEMSRPSPVLTSPLEVSPSASLECMNNSNYADPLDNPFLIEFTDLTQLLNSSLTDTNVPDSPLDFNTLSPVISPVFPSGDTVDPSHDLGLLNLTDSSHLFSLTTTVSEIENGTSSSKTVDHKEFDIDLACLSSNDLNTLLNTPDGFSTDQLSLLLSQTQDLSSDVSSDSNPSSPVSQTSKKTQKRKASEVDSDDGGARESQRKKKKYLVRRQKNNEASRVSRAKRREKHSTIFTRVTDLEEENARLRVDVKQLEVETEKLKKLLVERLSR